MYRSAVRQALTRDKTLTAVLLTYIAITVVYFLRLPYRQIEHLAWFYLGHLVQLLAIASVQVGLRRSEDGTGRRFWNYFSFALVLVLAGSLLETQLPELSDQVLGSLLVDCLYASYYVTLIFATELRPDLGPVTPNRGREEELHRGSAVAFILALLFYCSVIPSQRNPEEYLTGRFSILLYFYVDVFFLARFAYLSGVARSARWRLVYRFMFAYFGCSAALLVAQYYSSLVPGGIPPYLGTKWDLLWYLAGLPLILAARVSRYVDPEAAAQPEDDAKRPYGPYAWEPMAFYAIAFPLLHLLLDSYGQLSPPSRVLQQGLVIVYFAFFGFLALVHSAFREKKRQLAEQALRESERRYRQLIESHPDAILIEQDGRIVYANATGAEKLGIQSAGEDRSFGAMGFPEPPDMLRGSLPMECRLAGPQGEMDLEVSFFDISYLGRPASQAIARDVTTAKRQRAESERLARLASLGQFSAAMAHEIRNPLAAIVMHSFFLAERLGKDDEKQDDENLRALADINAAVDRMQKLVGGVLAFVRPAAMQLVEEDLAAVIHSATLDLRRQADLSKIHLVEDYRHHDATVEVDVHQMVAVFANILLNAVRAMPDGGTLTLHLDNPSEDCLGVVVEDTGVGIAEEDLARIFEPFFTRRDGGVGLGLALAARVLDQHACRYRVESEPGTGTRFIVEMDLADPK